MIKSIKSKLSLKHIIIFISLFVIIFTRFYNLENTGVFFWDQSRDLVKIHQYWVDKKITLIGPIAEENTRVFSSLTYYMLMPFAVMGNFDAISTTYGAAFWGVATALLIGFLVYRINKKLFLLTFVLLSIWFPLVEISRNAWNPNFIPFWIALGLIFYQYKKIIYQLFAGIALGLSIHHHYLSLFAVACFILIDLITSLKNRKILPVLLLGLGFVISILPFYLFDLRHPPGLFITRATYFNHTNYDVTFNGIIARTIKDTNAVLYYFLHNQILVSLCLFCVGILLFIDLKQKSKALLYFFPFLVQIIAMNFISDSFMHYFLPGLVFFLAWIIYPRQKAKLIPKIILIILVFGSILTISSQLLVPTWSPSIKNVREITDIMKNDINARKISSVNLAVLASKDNQTYGARYRDLLLLDEVRILSRYEYFSGDYLYVISEESEKRVRGDAAAEMFNFKTGLLENNWKTIDGKWKVYLFSRNKPQINNEGY